MIVATVVIGEKYQAEAQRLIRSIGLPVTVINESHPQYNVVSEDELINALWHKANFANLIDGDENEPVLFCDADLFSLHENPLSSFAVQSDTDFAYVPYKGKWFLPDQKRQEAFDYHGHKINSGFMYFRSLKLAKEICSKWQHEYLEREKLYDVEKGTSKYEYDEWALMIALKDSTYKIELLDRKWNEWELSTEEEIRKSSAILVQSHNFLDILDPKEPA